MEDLYIKDEEDEPFKAEEIRMWSIKTISKMMIFGVPRIIFLIITYIIVLTIGLFFTKKNEKFQNIVMTCLARIKLWIFGYWKIHMSKESKQNLKNSDAQIIIANHSSYMDTCVMGSLFPTGKFIASEFISKIPLLKNLGKTKCIYLTSEFSGNLTDIIQKELNRGSRIVFFSEGVCSRPDLLLKLRSGAFVPNLKILPVHINYENSKFWVNGEQDMLSHIINHISSRRNKLEVKVLPEYIPSEEEKSNIELFKENFRKYYAKGTGIKLSKKDYKDHPYFKLKK